MFSRAFLVVIACFALACAPDRARQEPDLAGGTGGAGAVSGGGAGGAGAVSGGGFGGHGGAGAAGAAGQSSAQDQLDAQVQDAEGMRVALITLACAGDCAEITVVAAGGNPPYTFAWQDGSTEASREVCLDDDASLRVTVTDTAIDNPEFPREAQTASAEVTADVLDACDDDDPPPVTCETQAPEGSFDPVVKWTWDEPGEGSMNTALVANLTDDNGDDVIDTNDIPDVVLNANQDLIVIDGETGLQHFRLEGAGSVVGTGSTTPALGDIDGDGVIDIVTVDPTHQLTAFHHDGSPMWNGAMVDPQLGSALSIADLDADGSPEIIGGRGVYSALGALEWSFAQARDITAPTAVDLDDDGFLEVVWGHVASRHDGELYYDNLDVSSVSGRHFPAIADLDGDGEPEIVVSSATALFVLDHAGATLRSVPVTTSASTGFPPAIADLDGDGTPEILNSDGQHYTAFRADLSTLWSMPVNDASSVAAGTAFDFLGDGTAEAMYGDESTSWGFDGATGAVVFMQPRSSGTMIEYPTIADVDNDGSADMLITSDHFFTNEVPTLQLISDRDNRWIPARRIMNQEGYHVTNVNEDGTIPRVEPPHWQRNNSFRAQAQIREDGTVCVPVPD